MVKQRSSKKGKDGDELTMKDIEEIHVECRGSLRKVVQVNCPDGKKRVLFLIRDDILIYGKGKKHVTGRMLSALNTDGVYIGEVDWAMHLMEMGIFKPEPRPGGSGNVCSIGFSEKDGKWYGWSHRAIHGFQMGDEVKEGDMTADSGMIAEAEVQHPEEDMSLPVGFVARTMEDAKRMAVAFAGAVS